MLRPKENNSSDSVGTSSVQANLSIYNPLRIGISKCMTSIQEKKFLPTLYSATKSNDKSII